MKNIIAGKIFFLVVLLFSSCASPKFGMDLPGEPAPFRPDVKLERGKGGKILFSMKYDVVGMDGDSALEFARNITQAFLYIWDERGLLDSTELMLVGGSVPRNDEKTNFQLSTDWYWENPEGKDFTKIEYAIVFHDDKKRKFFIREEKDLSPIAEETNSTPPISLTSEIEIKSDSLVTFAVIAKRNRLIQDYFPSSERLRVEILSPKGKIVWSSNYTKMYMQVVTPVEPLVINYFKRYEVDWNGMTNGFTRLPYGTYTVNLILPVKPSPYSVSTDFEWKAMK